jgi:hypothetical protein
VPPAIFRCRSELVSNAAGSQGIDLVAPHVVIVGLADGFELACNDEIEHLASFDAEQGSGIRPAQERGGGSHVENLFDGLPRRAAEVQAT